MILASQTCWLMLVAEKGLTEKAKAFFYKVIEKWGEPDVMQRHGIIWQQVILNMIICKRQLKLWKEEIYVAGSIWNPSKNCLDARLESLKGKGDLEGAGEIIRPVRDKYFFIYGILDKIVESY